MTDPKTLVMLLDQGEALKLLKEQLGGPSNPTVKPAVTEDKDKKSAKPVKHVKPLKPRPIWRGYQLIGDSMMGRLAAYLGHNVPYNRETNKKQLGLITHGQTVGRLLGDLHNKANSPALAEKVIVMIGTNDITHDTPIGRAVSNVKRILALLARRCKEVIILTLPPIPAAANSFDNVVKINTCIKEQSVLEFKNVKVVDTSSIFGATKETVREDLYEKTFKGSNKKDMVHWNNAGMREIVSALKAVTSS